LNERYRLAHQLRWSADKGTALAAGDIEAATSCSSGAVVPAVRTGAEAYVERTAGIRSKVWADRSILTGAEVHKSDPSIVIDADLSEPSTTEVTDAIPRDAPTAQASPQARDVMVFMTFSRCQIVPVEETRKKTNRSIEFEIVKKRSIADSASWQTLAGSRPATKHWRFAVSLFDLLRALQRTG